MEMDLRCKLQAHRGVSTDAPENTMAAFRLAVELGYDIIEFDPKYTKDDVCVVLHDRTLNRTGRIAGKKLGDEPIKISDTTFADLSDIDVGEWFNGKFCGEHIPTFTQVLDYMKSVDMETKIDNVIQQFSEEQIQKMFDSIEKHGNDRVGLTCSDLMLLERFAVRFPKAPLHYDGAVSEEALNLLAKFSAGHKTVVWMRLDNKATAWNTTPPVSEEYATLIKSKGFLLGVWILHTDEEMQQATDLGADIVETTGGIKPKA